MNRLCRDGVSPTLAIFIAGRPTPGRPNPPPLAAEAAFFQEPARPKPTLEGPGGQISAAVPSPPRHKAGADLGLIAMENTAQPVRAKDMINWLSAGTAPL